MQLAISAEGRVTPNTVHGDAEEFISEFLKLRKDFVIQRHLAATDWTPTRRVKSQRDRLPANVAQVIDADLAQTLVRVLGETLLGVGRVVISRVFEGVKAAIAQRHGASGKGLGIGAQGRRRLGTLVASGHSADGGQQPLQMPAPHGQAGFFHAACRVGGDGGLGPFEDRLIIGQNTAQASDGRRIGHRIRVVNMAPVGGGQGRAQDLMNLGHQFGRGRSA
jgi:hypothetical protein